MSSGHTADALFPSFAVAASTAARVASWRRLTLKGNLAVEDGHDIRARPHFEEALSEAEQMFAAAVSADDADAARLAPALYGMSCSDIVELARRQGDEVTVGIYLYRVAARLIAVADSAEAPFDLRARCLRHLVVASRALYRYFEQHGMWQAAQAYSARENAALFSMQEMKAAAAKRAS
jgi:hypothetical protein